MASGCWQSRPLRTGNHASSAKFDFKRSLRNGEKSILMVQLISRTSTKSLGDRVEIKIRDNGTGIPPEIKDKAVQPLLNQADRRGDRTQALH
jgi:signal transduction histidine kinase